MFEERGIDVSLITKAVIELSAFKNDHDLQAKHLKGFSNLVFLNIKYNTGTGKPVVGFLEPLTKLKWLEFSNGILPPLPTNSAIEVATLEYGSFLGSFGGCQKLKILLLSTWELETELKLSSCLNLMTLVLDNISSESVFTLVRGVKSLEWITITRCNLLYVPTDIFEGMQNLQHLKLSNNVLTEITMNGPMPSLLTLDLNTNALQYSKATEIMLENMPKLRKLILKNNMFFDLCGSFSTAVYPVLKILDVSDTTTKFECIDSGKVPALNEFHIEFYLKPIINLHNLVKWPHPLYVNLQNNKIKDINLTREDYETLRKYKSNITFNGDIRLKCDCQHAYFARAIRENLLTWILSDVICEDMDGISLKQTVRKQTECNRSPCGDCVCRRMWWSNVTEADCRGAAATRIPQVEGLQILLAPDNRIQLRSEDIPDTLTHLDLTQNNIVSLDEDVARKLFSTKNRTMLLAGDKFLCKCEYRDFIKLVQDNQNQILDYKKLLCAGEKDRFLHKVDVNELCIDNTAFVASLSACGALLSVILLSVILNYCYGQQIRVFLYARGWCHFCFKEDEDFSRTYDAFVSFCHEDEDLASQELVPKLEQLGFRICVHYRDWVPGDLIPNQIIRSVEASRRTIIVLSKNFVQSKWSSLEFKTAHARALKEGVPRVIVIVLDDVINSQYLDEDIRSYVRNNTYVNWNDAWLWDKLQYAMRRRGRWQNRGEIDTRNSS